MTQALVLNQITFIDIIGQDSKKFLQGQISINIDAVNSDRASLGCFCNPKGRIVCLFHITAIEQGFRLFMPQSIVTAALEHLKKYGVFYKVTITSAANDSTSSDQYQLLIQSGAPEIQETESNWHSIPNTDLFIAVETIKANNQETQPTSIKQKSDGDQQWFWQLAEGKTPWLDESTVAQFLPHDLNLPELDAVDFKKGCFTGQEVIARMHYKGKLKQHLQLLSTANLTDLAPLTKLQQEEKSIGKVICSIANDANEWLLLALIKDSADPDKNIQLNIENSPILQISIQDAVFAR